MLAELLSSTNYSRQVESTVDEETIEEAQAICDAEENLIDYIKQAWHVVEPGTPFVPGWHIDAICEHLVAVQSLQIRNLIINMPPRHMKSLAVSVFFPTWAWINDPYSRFLYSSYADSLSTRDALKSRRLIQSPWYQQRWGDVFQLTSDQNQKTRYDNDKYGYRLSTSVGGLGTGEGGDYIVVDDPHNVKQAESDVQRKSTLLWWDETMSTRLNNPKTGRKIVVMQRLHENDLTGHILSEQKGGEYVHLVLPAEYEKGETKTTFLFQDPRTEEGELLWETVYGRKELDNLKKELVSEYAIQGQLQQRPIKRGGQLFLTDNIEIVEGAPKSMMEEVVRYWDKAGTKDGGCYTAGVLMARMRDESYIVLDVVRGQWEAGQREQVIKSTTIQDNNDYGDLLTTWIEQEGGSGGKESAENTIKKNVGYHIRAETVTGDKVVRATPLADQVEISNVKIIAADWTKPYLHELEFFPMGAYRDQVDSSSGAFNKLAETLTAGTW